MKEEEILDIKILTKDMIINDLKLDLSKKEIDEYLDILSDINDGQFVFNVITNNDEYLLIIKGDENDKQI